MCTCVFASSCTSKLYVSPQQKHLHHMMYYMNKSTCHVMQVLLLKALCFYSCKCTCAFIHVHLNVHIHIYISLHLTVSMNKSTCTST